MQCPRCRSELRQLTWEANITVDECVSCRGVWLDKGELERIQETIERDYSAKLGRISTVGQAYELARQKAARGIRCPRCDHDLHKKEYGYCSQIMIDLCPQGDGIWLDRGELEALEMFFERERADERKHANEEEQADTQGVRRGFWASLASLFPEKK